MADIRVRVGSRNAVKVLSSGLGVQLGNLSDVNLDNKVDGAVLVYNGETQVFDAQTYVEYWNVDNLTLDGNTLSSTNENGDITILPNGSGDVAIGASFGTLYVKSIQTIFESTDSIQIPSGTTAQRDSSPVAGQIRYNTELSSFEGYGPGDSWGSLGGVKDVDQDTYILPETAAGSDEDILYFYNAGYNSATISSTTTTLNTNLFVGGTSEFIGVVTFRGGTISIGDSITDDIVFGGEVASNLVPTDDNTYDLGGSTKMWRDLYLKGRLNAGDIVLDFPISGISTRGAAYINSEGKIVSTNTPEIGYASTSNYILTTDESNVPVWTNVLDGGSY